MPTQRGDLAMECADAPTEGAYATAQAAEPLTQRAQSSKQEDEAAMRGNEEPEQPTDPSR